MDKKRVQEISLQYTESLLQRGEITFDDLGSKLFVFAAHNDLPQIEVEQFVATILTRLTNRVANTKIEFSPLSEKRMREIAHIFAVIHLRGRFGLRRRFGNISSQEIGICTKEGEEYFMEILPEFLKE